MKATPIPWVFDGDNEQDGFDIFCPAPEYNGILATTYYQCGEDPEDKEEAEANARLIVKAVNLHDELVEALQLIAKFPCNCPPDIGNGECESCIARAVLAKAKEGGE